MQYLNLGLPRCGLESIRIAMAQLGVKTRPRKPFTHRDWLDRIQEIELLQGNPFSPNYKKVIATLQSIADDQIPQIFYSYRPLEPWLESCEQHHQEPSNDTWENDGRQRLFNTIVFHRDLYIRTWSERLALAHSFKGCKIINMHMDDRLKWECLKGICRHSPKFPHENKTPTPLTHPYKPSELVA